MDDLFPKKDPYLFGEAAPPPKYKKRRRIDPNENLPAIKKVIKDLENQDVTLEDFVLLVSPHTGDKGATLNKVMAEDIATFHKMVVKNYDAMTEDVSDVLANEQMDLVRMYAEKQRICLQKIEHALQEMHDINPDFDFREYYKDPTKYLASLFKLADMPDDEEIEIARRQLTYHRLNWLQSEGERLQAENNKLQQHLNDLKLVQRDEIVAMVEKEREEELKKAELERQEAEKRRQLEELNVKLHKTIVGGERRKMTAKKMEEKKAMKKGRPPVKERPPWQSTTEEEWNVKAATALEETLVQESQATIKSAGRPSLGTGAGPSTSRAAAAPKATSKEAGGAKKKSTIKKKSAPKPRPEWKDVDLDEFGVDTADAAAQQEPVELFRRSPKRSPPRPQAPTCPDTCPSTRQPSPPAPAGRRARAPRDSWGGFY